MDISKFLHLCVKHARSEIQFSRNIRASVTVSCENCTGTVAYRPMHISPLPNQQIWEVFHKVSLLN